MFQLKNSGLTLLNVCPTYITLVSAGLTSYISAKNNLRVGAHFWYNGFCVLIVSIWQIF